MKAVKILILLMFCLGGIFAQEKSSFSKQTDLVYKKVGDWEGKLDFYKPNSNAKYPLVIYIHGGGWTHGKKEAEFDKFSVFLENGYAVANIEYRLANQAVAPAAVEDVYCAIQYLIANAKKLNFNANKVVLMGGSAGAHLALLVGLQNDKSIFVGNCTEQAFKPKAIISKYGPTDLLTWPALYKKGSASAGWLDNRMTDTVFLKSLSPTNYMSNHKIPVLFIHGDDDQTVPIQQSLLLYGNLKRNPSTELLVIKGGKHGNFPAQDTKKMNEKMLSFLKDVLK